MEIIPDFFSFMLLYVGEFNLSLDGWGNSITFAKAHFPTLNSMNRSQDIWHSHTDALFDCINITSNHTDLWAFLFIFPSVCRDVAKYIRLALFP